MAALAILLVVIALIIWAVVAFGGGSSDNTEQDQSTNAAVTSAVESSKPVNLGTSSTSATTSASDSASEASTAKETTSKDPQASTTVAADAKKTCELKDLVITANTNNSSFVAGEQPELFMTVHNPTAVDCEINLEENVLRFEVYDLATNARIWSDVDCNPAIEDGTSVFPAGKDRYFQATWSRTNSAPGQCDNRQAVPAGAYYLHTVVGTNPSAAVTFNLA
ncbi:hypothetical protein SFC07_10665 [Corynebacterium callunae]|uniref:hypothetical protein n=1 Tax=Corynebacterium callunae TaxID=1721 RepID=UPI00398265AF